MKLKLKQATLVKVTGRKATVILTVQKRNKTAQEITVVADKKKNESIVEFFNDYWNSIEVDGVLYDVNFWHEEKGLIRATVYPTRKNGEFIETVTNDFSGCKMKFTPLSEYKLS